MKAFHGLVEACWFIYHRVRSLKIFMWDVMRKLTEFKYDGVRARLANINYPCITHFYLPESGSFEVLLNNAGHHQNMLNKEEKKITPYVTTCQSLIVD